MICLKNLEVVYKIILMDDNSSDKTIKIGAQKVIRSKRGITSHSERFLKFNLSKWLYLLSSLN